MTEGEVRHPTSGVNARKADNGNVEGAEIVNVRDGSAAEEGGLREGDIVTRVGDREVHSSDELVVAVRRAGADGDVPVELIRDGSRGGLPVRPRLGGGVRGTDVPDGGVAGDAGLGGGGLVGRGARRAHGRA